MQWGILNIITKHTGLETALIVVCHTAKHVKAAKPLQQIVDTQVTQLVLCQKMPLKTYPCMNETPLTVPFYICKTHHFTLNAHYIHQILYHISARYLDVEYRSFLKMASRN
jgi:hypothetical protein